MSVFYDTWWKKKQSYIMEDFFYKWPIIKKLLPKNKFLTFLDYGCGSGKILEEIIRINPQNKYIGMDVSKEAINRAKKKNPKVKFYLVSDGKKLPLKNKSVDFITALDVVEHVYNTELLFEEFARILKRGGKIIITTPYYGFIKNLMIVLFGFEKIFDPMTPHIRFFTVRTLTKCLKQNNLKIEGVGYFGRFFPIWRAFYTIASK
jgi:ubiquinone/menaquinone biosynthesis C-methylase UbiE